MCLENNNIVVPDDVVLMAPAEETGSGRIVNASLERFLEYPLVNVYITMENQPF